MSLNQENTKNIISKGKVMGKLEGKVAVITGGSSGMALASAKRFVEEGAYVFITGRRQEALNEAVKLITGLGEPLLGRLLTFDALSARWREIPVRPDPRRAPAGRLEDIAIACGIPAAASTASDDALRTISAPRLAERLAARDLGADDFDLVDVREPAEHELVAIPGARLVPRAGFLDGSAFALFDPDRELILHCRSGVRSAEVLALATARGFDARHLDGGVLAWVDLVEPHKPRY